MRERSWLRTFCGVKPLITKTAERSRQNAKSAIADGTIHDKISPVEGENSIDTFTASQVNQRGGGELRTDARVLLHQVCDRHAIPPDSAPAMGTSSRKPLGFPEKQLLRSCWTTVRWERNSNAPSVITGQ